MASEVLYDFTDSEGVDRVVREIPGTGGLGGPGDNFQVPVIDVEDVESSQKFPGVPYAARKRRNS